MTSLFFDNWHSLIRTAVSTVLAYITLVAMLRISGKRTLAKMNAFDFIVTVALGSTFATIALSKDVSIASGAVAFLVLILMQFSITWLSVRWNFVKKLVASQPTMLLYKGNVLHHILKKERISMEDLYVAARIKGITELTDIDVIVLETTGDFTIIEKMTVQSATTLSDVKNYDENKAIHTVTSK